MQKNKIFQDSTQGYINVPEEYVLNLIDTKEVQRIKDVSQTGLRAVYSGATHDRFSHSMGVYNIGCQIYDAFLDNVVRTVGNGLSSRVKDLLDKWRKLFHIACLLHDIGHPAFSHTLEFLYNSPYVCIDIEKKQQRGIKIDVKEVNRFYKRFLKASPYDKNKRYLKIKLLEEIINKEKQAHFKSQHTISNLENFNPAPHEMMGAYLILTDKNLQERIKKAYGNDLEDESYAFIARMITGIEYDPIATSDISVELSLRNCVIGLLNGKIDADSIDYLNRNSHFAGYSTSKLDLTRLCDSFSAHFDEKRKIFIPCLKKSALSTLDSFISARNFEPKWLYSHHKLVYYNDFLIKFLVKMCGQYIFAKGQRDWEKAIVRGLKNRKSEFYKDSDGEKIKELVLKYFESKNAVKRKHYNSWQEFYNEELSEQSLDDSIIKKLLHAQRPSAISLLEEIEPEGTLTKCARYELLDFFVGILIFYANKIFNLFDNYMEDNSEVIEGCDNFKLVINFIGKISDMFGRLRVSCTDYFFSPQANVSLKVKGAETYNFDFCSDAHFRKLFLDFGIMYPIGSRMPDEIKSWDDAEDVRRQYRHKLFTEVLEEYKTRNLRQSLWKTYEEYNLFICSLAQKHGLSEQTIKEEFHFLIKKGHTIDFEDVIATVQETKAGNIDKKGGNSVKKYERVYTNYPHYSESYCWLEGDNEFNLVFGFLGDGLIIRFYSCHYKDFSQIPIQFENNVYNYGEVVKMLTPEDFSFPYIYYSCDQTETTDKKEILDKLGNNLINYILSKKNLGEDRNMGKNSFDTGKTIRDSVHGDIFVPNKFLKIIDCRVFQRLHRIKQLATADMIFPEAVHTRFAHSLGTFYVTGIMMDHFCEILEALNIECQQTEKDAILAAALLHDLGHGPYSHAYEHIGKKKKSHEDWTKEIIKNDPELKTVLEKEFGVGFADKVVACLDKKEQKTENYSLSNIFSEIISSNLDADRMDYLMRDAYNTGMKFGIFDLQKLISSMELIEQEGKAKIALRMDSLPAIEQFLFGRYNMYSEVYFAPYKLALEQILAKICERIDDKDTDNSSNLYKLFHNGADLSLYLKMDDYSFMAEIENIANTRKDEILRLLIESLKTRGGFKRMRMSVEDSKKFLYNWEKRFPDAKKIRYGILSVGEDFKAYEANDKEILIVGNNGVVSKFSEVSRLYDAQRGGNKLWHTLTGYIYFNEEILRQELFEINDRMDVDKILSELKSLFEKYDSNKHTEIENKYDCSSESIEVAKNVEDIFMKPELTGFKCDGGIENKEHTDIYYDTDDFLLANNKYSFRCRQCGLDEHVFTIKKPTNTVGENRQAQFIRSEFEEKKQSDDINEAQDLFDEYLVKDLQKLAGRRVKLTDLKPVVTIVNNRASYYVKDDGYSGFNCEVSLDSIRYKDQNGNEKPDYQVEIELKCKYTYRLRMNQFAEKFCEAVGISGNSRAKESKYLKALASLNLN